MLSEKSGNVVWYSHVCSSVDAFVIAISTAIGDVVKENVDPNNEKKSAMFFLYIFIVFIIAFGLKLLLYCGYGFGGGSLVSVFIYSFWCSSSNCFGV